jgi:hypothetical protein
MVVVLVVHPCIMAVSMDLLHTMIDLMVPPCIAFGQIGLPYIVFEVDFVLESWGSQIDWEKFLVEECPPN